MENKMGKWKKVGSHFELIEPSQEYIEQRKQKEQNLKQREIFDYLKKSDLDLIRLIEDIVNFLEPSGFKLKKKQKDLIKARQEKRKKLNVEN